MEKHFSIKSKENVKYINRLEQFGKVQYDLILDNGQRVVVNFEKENDNDKYKSEFANKIPVSHTLEDKAVDRISNEIERSIMSGKLTKDDYRKIIDTLEPIKVQAIKDGNT
jgi:hypothetical protein